MKTKKQKSIKYTVNLKAIIFLMVLAAIILSIVPLVRPNILIGSEPYYHLRLAESPFAKYDELSYSGRFRLFSAWPLVLFSISKIFNTSLLFTSKILPPILGIFSALIFYFILRKTEPNPLIQFVASFILIISPSFVYLFTISNSHTMPVFIGLLSFLLILNNRRILASLLILTLPFFGATHALIAGILLLIYVLKEKKLFYLPVLFLLILVSLYPVLLLGFPETVRIGNQSTLTQLISDLGASFGISIFALILAGVGLLKLWEKKYKHIFFYVILILLIIIMFFQIKTIFYLNLFLAYLATLGLVKLMEVKWESETIQHFLLLILFLGLFFSTISFTTTLTKIEPNEEIIEGLLYLKSITKPTDTILSHRSRGHWITAIAKRKNVIDENYIYAPDVNQRYADLQKFYSLRDEKEALKILKKYSVTYIWLDKAAKNLIWDKPNQGISFLLEFSDKIKKIYKHNNIEIWEIRAENTQNNS